MTGSNSLMTRYLHLVCYRKKQAPRLRGEAKPARADEWAGIRPFLFLRPELQRLAVPQATRRRRPLRRARRSVAVLSDGRSRRHVRRPMILGRNSKPPALRRRECTIIDHHLGQVAVGERVVTWSRGL